MSDGREDKLLGLPVKIVPGGTLVSGDRPWILGPPLSAGGHTVNWVRFADRPPPPLQPVIVWTLNGTWFQATLYRGRFYQSNTNVVIGNVTHYCEITAPVD